MGLFVPWKGITHVAPLSVISCVSAEDAPRHIGSYLNWVIINIILLQGRIRHTGLKVMDYNDLKN